MPGTKTPLSGGNLHEAGFNGAPRPLGIDSRGREVLTFIPGPPAWPDQFRGTTAPGGMNRAGATPRQRTAPTRTGG